MSVNLIKENFIGIAVSVLLMVLSIQPIIPLNLSFLEAIAVVTSGWSVWFLSKNNFWGWWIGLIGVVLYIIVFYEVKLYGDVAIQVFYFITSCQGIYVWLKGGSDQTEKPIGRVAKKVVIISLIGGIMGVVGVTNILIALRGAAPFWDAITTVGSVIAQLYLMQRYVESWYIWIAMDTIYIPLYASRDLYLTSFLYVIFWLMAFNGLQNFRRLYQEQQNDAKKEGEKLP